jgi:hypothetical protein
VSGPVFVLLGEDSATDGPQVMRRLVTAALQCLAEGLQTHLLQFHTPPPGLLRLVHAQGWANRREQVMLVQALTTELKAGRIVVLHYDADCPWGQAPAADERFQRRVREPVQRSAGDTDRLVVMVPHTCIESWTYRNTARALELCQDRGLDPTLHAQWAVDPALLETTMSIKELSPLRDQHNLVLVQTGWPRQGAQADGRSFARLVERLEAVPGLAATLPVPPEE